MKSNLAPRLVGLRLNRGSHRQRSLCQAPIARASHRTGRWLMAAALAIALLLVLGHALRYGLARTPSANVVSPKPELVVQASQSHITGVALSPDGRWLVSAANVGNEGATLWEVSTGLKVRILSPAPVASIAFSSDGKRVVSGGADGAIKVWEIPSGREVQILGSGGQSAVPAVVLSSDDKWLAAATRDHVKVFDIETGKQVHEFVGAGDVLTVAFSPDGNLLASSGLSDNGVTVWEVPTGQQVARLCCHTGDVPAAAFSPDGRWVASASYDKTIKLWEVASRMEVGALAGHAGRVRAVGFSPDGRTLASASSDGTIRIWDIAMKREIRKISGIDCGSGFTRAGTVVYKSCPLTFAPDGRSLAGFRNGGLALWDVSSGVVRRSLGGTVEPSEIVAISQDGREAKTLSGRSQAGAWDFPAGRWHRTFLDLPPGEWAPSGGGRWVVYLGEQDAVELFDLASGRKAYDAGEARAYGLLNYAAGGLFLQRALAAHLGPEEPGEPRGLTHAFVREVFDLSSDAKWMAQSWGDGTVVTRETTTGRRVRTFDDESGLYSDAVVFTPDARLLASGTTIHVKIWDVDSGREVRTIPEGANRLAFSTDGRRLATAIGGGVKVWDVSSGEQMKALKGSAFPLALTFSPDGTWLVAACDDGSTRIWDSNTGELLATLVLMADTNDWLVVTPDGLFDGTEQGVRKLVAWRISNRVYPPDRFFADFYTPGLLARLYAGEHPRPTIDMASLKLPPDVRIQSPSSSATTKQGQAIVTAEAEDLGGGVAEVRLYQNGKLVGTRPGARGVKSTYAFDVQLIPGENILRATAVSKERVESNEDWVRVVYEAPQPVQPVLHLLAVGINRYEDSAFNLGYARQDGEAIAHFFEQRGKRLFQSVDTVKLFDSEATQANIRKALDRLVEQSKPEDVLLVYMAGHGVGLGQQYYFLPHEMHSEGDDEAAIRQYGLQATVLGDYLRHIPALKQILVLDACESGTALPVLAKLVTFRGFSAPERKAAQMLARSNGVYLIAASTKQQEAVEVPELGHGVLAYALLSGLGEQGEPKASTAEGMVTVYSLLQYVNEQVPELTEKYHNGDRQYPVSFNTGMDFPLVVR